jgi:histidine triad (HIT) family protein
MHFLCDWSGSEPAHIIYGNDLTVAFLDIAPASNGHTLVIPRIHSTDLFSTNQETARAIIETSRVIAIKLKSRLDCEGLNLFQSNGVAAW